MVLEVLGDLVALGLLLLLDAFMRLLILLVLLVVVPRDVLELQAHHLGFLPSALELQCLLVVELLHHLSVNRRRANFLQERNQTFREEVIEGIRSRLKGPFCSMAGARGDLRHLALQLSKEATN